MLTSDYILGLIDGEGSFTVYVRNPDDSTPRKRRVKVEPRFYVKLIEKDKDILYELKDFFGCGNVYFQGDKRKSHQNCYRYEVANRQDLLQKIIPFFQKNKLRFASKQNDFEIFCKIMEHVKNKEHLTNKGWKKIYLLKKQMH